MTPSPPGPTPAAKPLLVVRNLAKAFPYGANVLNGVNLEVFPGDAVTVLGGSGCGKSTLLNILIGVDDPTSGTVHVLGQNIHSLPRRQRKRLMRDVGDRKSTRLNSSHLVISYAVFCLKKKKQLNLLISPAKSESACHSQ